MTKPVKPRSPAHVVLLDRGCSMSRWSRLVIPLACLLTATAFAGDNSDKDDSAKTHKWPRVRLGGIMIGAGYSHFSGPMYPYYPYYYSPYGSLWNTYAWDPFFYGPYVHPGFLYGFHYGPSMGELKLKSEDKDAWVYLDGALAGKAEKLKSMWLEPGVYKLEVRSGSRKFDQKVYVLSGKTLRLTADLEKQEVRP